MKSFGVFYTALSWTYMIAHGISFTMEGSLDGQNATGCQAIVRLKCKTDSQKVDIRFGINGTDVATCLGNCFLNAPIPGRYSIVQDISVGMIELFINSTSHIDESNTFQCTTEGKTYTIQPQIKVFPQNETTNMTYPADKNDPVTNITVTTGCIRNTEIVGFVWQKTKTRNGNDLQPLDPLEYNQSQLVFDNTFCDPDRHCDGIGRSNTINLKTDGSDPYYIHCTVIVNDSLAKGNVTKISDKQFYLRDASGAGPNSALTNEEIAGIVVGTIAFAVILIVLGVIFVLKKGNKCAGGSSGHDRDSKE